VALTLPPLGGGLLWHANRWIKRLFALAAARSGDPEIPASIVAKAQQGNHAAFRRIVRHYDDRLRALAFRLLEDRDAMDDALQEAYVKAFRSLNTFKGNSSLGTWLYRITYNSCIDELRRREKVIPLTTRDGEDLQISDPSDAIGAADMRADLASAMSGLPPDQRAAVMLVDADGFSYDEASKVLGIPPGTVASRVSRARAALRTALGAAR
jgi:RNA polymerase sigma-70 factor (ECF subfamily)